MSFHLCRTIDHAMMTGTGSAVYGIFRKDADTAAVEKQLAAAYGFCRRCECVGRSI